MSLDEDSEFQLGSSSSQFHYPGPSRAAVRSRSRTHERDGGDDTVRGRKNKRFSFASALLEAMKDRVRSHSPIVDGAAVPVQGQGHAAGDMTPPRGRTLDRGGAEDDSAPAPVHKEVSALGRVSEVLGLEGEEGREHGDGWKEFRKGA